MKLVIIESPYSSKNGQAGINKNIEYARAAMKDCLIRGEAPYASHLLYTQDGVLDDNIDNERYLGINAGFAWGKVADYIVVYTDLGISAGMKYGIKNHEEYGFLIEYRTIKGWGT